MLRRARAEHQALVTLCADLTAVLPAIQSMTVMQHVHGMRYDGPTFNLPAAQAVLDSPFPPEEVPS
jgi:hypothetical protein